MAYPAVGVNVIILQGGEVLLTRRADNGKWCLPGGMVELGETLAQAMRREVREEISCDIDVEHLVGVYSSPNLRLTSPARQQLIVVAATASITAGTPGSSDEVTAVRYFSVDAFPEMVPNQTERVLHALDGGGPRLL